MSENKTLTLATPFQSKAEHNVQGWERAGSVATGVVMVGKGLRRGGFFGLIQIAIGGVARIDQKGRAHRKQLERRERQHQRCALGPEEPGHTQ